jgi:hypothetical protein
MVYAEENATSGELWLSRNGVGQSWMSSERDAGYSAEISSV